MSALLGEHDCHLRRIEEAFPSTDITVRGNEVHLTGDDADTAATLFEELVVMVNSVVSNVMAPTATGANHRRADPLHTPKGKPFSPLNCMKNN